MGGEKKKEMIFDEPSFVSCFNEPYFLMCTDLLDQSGICTFLEHHLLIFFNSEGKLTMISKIQISYIQSWCALCKIERDHYQLWIQLANKRSLPSHNHLNVHPPFQIENEISS